MTSLFSDVRQAARNLSRSPGFTALAAAILGVGIGAAVSVFSAVDAVLFRTIDAPDPRSLVRIYSTDEKGEELSNHSYPVFDDYRRESKSFSALAGFDDAEAVHLATNGKPERETAAIVSGTFFPLLGARAARGRLLTPDDDRIPGGHPVLVISDRLWRRRFGAEDRAVGASVRLNGHPFTVVGVAPARFSGVDLDGQPDLWIPAAMVEQAQPSWAAEHPLRSRRMSWLDVVGRLMPGTSIAAAQAELDAIARRRAAGQPEETRDPMARVVAADEYVLGPDARPAARRVSWMLLAAAGLLMTIACADAAALLLLRAERRRREIAVRLAIGASRVRILRLLLAEGALLSLLAAAAGLLFAVWGTEALAALAPDDFPVPLGASSRVFDPRVLAFTLLAAAAAAMAFALAPALSASRIELSAAMKGASAVPRPGRATPRDLLVSAQVALSVVLLVGAALMTRTLAAAGAVRPGFDPAGRLEASVDVAQQGYSDARGAAFFDALLERLRALPGVASAALARTVPVQRSGMRVTVGIEGYQPPAGEHPNVDFDIVSPGFFEAIGARVVAGRDFRDSDGANAPRVAIVSEAMARRFWPGESPIGRRIRSMGPGEENVEVVGVASDMRMRTLRQPAAPTVYVPLRQSYESRMTVLVRARGDAAALARPVEAAVGALDPSLPLFRVRTLEEKLRGTLGQERLIAALVSAFGSLALLLAAAGLYAVVSYATQIRTREFGIRMALGATGRHVRALVLRGAARTVAIGLGAGIAAAALASHGVRHMLFEVSPLDPFAYALAAATLTAAAVLASAGPARRATRVDPSSALRNE